MQVSHCMISGKTRPISKRERNESILVFFSQNRGLFYPTKPYSLQISPIKSEPEKIKATYFVCSVKKCTLIFQQIVQCGTLKRLLLVILGLLSVRWADRLFEPIGILANEVQQQLYSATLLVVWYIWRQYWQTLLPAGWLPAQVCFGESSGHQSFSCWSVWNFVSFSCLLAPHLSSSFCLMTMKFLFLLFLPRVLVSELKASQQATCLGYFKNPG